MEKVIEEACKILERTKEDDKFEYIEANYTGYRYGSYYGYSYSGSCNGYGYNYGYSYNDTYEDDYDDIYYFIIEFYDKKGMQWYETYASSEAEAIGRCLMNHPEVPYSHIMDVCKEKL